MSGNTSKSVHNVKSGPQAKDDAARGSENGILLFDVMANDAGGNGRSLWSLDQADSATRTAADAKVTLASGARIWFVDGRVAYDPGSAFDRLPEGATAIETFRYAIRMGNGAVSYATVSVTVIGSNDGPVAVADTASATENGALVVDVLANDTDKDDGHALTLLNVAVPAGGGAVSIEGDKLVFTPGASFDHLAVGETAEVTVSYTVADDRGATSASTLTLTITGSNDAVAIVAADAAGAVAEDGAPSASGRIAFTDPDGSDGHTASFVATGNATALGVFSLTDVVEAAGAADGVVGWTYALDEGAAQRLAAGRVVSETYRVTVTDGNGASVVQDVTLTITGTNDGPVAVADAAATAENAAFTLDVLANDTDVDDGHVLTLRSAAAPAGQGTVAVVGGKLAFAPGGDFDRLAEGATETVTLTYVVADEHGATSTSTVTLTVTGANDAPVVTSTAVAAAGAVREAGEIAGTPSATGTLTSRDVDDAATARWSGTADGVHGAFAIDANTGAWTYALDDGRAATQALAEGETATETFLATVTDDRGATATQLVTVTIAGTNDAPVVTSTAAAAAGAVREAGDAADAGTPSARGVLTSADVDGGATAAWSGDAAGAYGDFAIDEATGAWTYKLDDADGGAADRLAEGETATETFLATVTDDKGATATRLVTLTITGANDAPVAVDDAAGVGEDGSVLIDVLANDTDVDAGATRSILAGSVSATNGTAVVEDGRIRFTPDADYHGPAAVAYRITDGSLSSGGSVAISVTAVNDAPVVAGPVEGAAVEDGASVKLDALAQAADVDDADLIVVGVPTDLPAGVSYDADARTFTLDPAAYQSLAAGAQRIVSVSYGVSDGSVTTPATARWTVTGVNDGPTLAVGGVASGAVTEAADDGADEAADVTHRATGAFGFADADVGDTHEIVGVAPAAAGYRGALTAAIDPATGTVSWTYSVADGALDGLAAGEAVDQTYTITLRDASGATVGRDVTVTLNGANDAPVAVADAGAADEDAAVTLLASNLLANDSDVDAGDTRAISAVQAVSAKGAAVSIDAAGNVSYDPTGSATLRGLAPGATTADSFAYTVTDAGGLSSTATVTIAVTGILGAPVALPDSLTVAENGTGSGEVIGNDVVTRVSVGTGVAVTAVNGDAAGVGRAVAGSTGGTFTVAADGTYSFVAGTAFDRLGVGESAVSTAAYTVTDIGGSDTETISVTVTGVNDAVVRGTIDAADFTDADGIRSGKARIYFSDADANDVHTASIRPLGEGYLGNPTVTIGKDADGQTYVDVDYSWSIADIDKLSIDQLLQRYEVVVSDGNGGDLTIVRRARLEDVEYYIGTASNEDLGWVLGDRNLLVGNGGSDRLIGGDIGDYLYGDAGPGLPEGEGNGPLDAYEGNGAFDDVLDGRGGADLLVGGAGADRLTGGAGADLFRFDRGDANGDVVTDFNAAEGDVLHFVGWGANATFEKKGATTWELANADRSVIEVITFANGAEITGTDYAFLM